MDSAMSEQKVLRGNIGRTYKLLELLGDGLTAQVYRAQADNPDEVVAVKVLRPGLEESIVKRFESEHRTVAAVWEALRAAAIDRTGAVGPNGLDDSSATPPQSFEFCAATDHQPAFVAMELMPGRKVEWLLVEHGAFAELLGLRLGLQLFGLLHILHSRMKRSYDDFKFENLWWEEETQRLRVTDWNVLGEEKDLAAKVHWDLERGARALLRVLTGVPMRPELRLDQQQHWNQLSVGAQALLKRLLDVDKARRPQTADDLCKELRLLIGYWLIEPARGLRNAEAALDGIAEGQDAATLDEETLRRVEPTVRQTLAALSVLHLRHQQGAATEPPAWPAELAQRLDTLQARAEQYAPSPERMVSTALTMLEGHSFLAAVGKLRDAAQLFPDHLPTNRWLELADALAAGKARAEGEKNRWQEAIRQCDAGRFDKAKAQLTNLPTPLATALRQEVKLQLAVASARDDNTEPVNALESAQAARGALNAIKAYSPTYAMAVQENLGLDLETLENSLSEQMEAIRIKYSATAELNEFVRLSEPSRLEEGVLRAEKRLHLFVDEPEVIECVLQLGEKCLDARRYVLAKRLFAVGAGLDHDRAPDFRLRWLVANAASLRSDNQTIQAQTEVEYANNAIAVALEKLYPDSADAMTTASLTKYLAPTERRPIFNVLAVTLTRALKANRAETRDVVGEALTLSELVIALSKALERQSPNSLGSAQVERLVQAVTGLSSHVMSVLLQFNRDSRQRLSTTKDQEDAKRRIAEAIGLPGALTIVEDLLRSLPDPDRVNHARQWSAMANRCGDLRDQTGAQSKSRPESPSVRPDLGMSRTLHDINQSMCDDLESNDPRRWDAVVTIPLAQRNTWTREVNQKAQERANEIGQHRRIMEQVFRTIHDHPLTAKENFKKWKEEHRQWASYWDPRKSDWVEADALWREVSIIPDTRFAQRCLDEALQWQNRGELTKARNSVEQGLKYRLAESRVLNQLEALRANLVGGAQSTPIEGHESRRMQLSGYPAISDPNHGFGNLQAALDGPLRETTTLTELRHRLQELMQSNEDFGNVLTAQYRSLHEWESVERWLADLDDTSHIAERSKSYAAEQLRNLEALITQTFWQPYIAVDVQTVFTVTKGRLSAIAYAS